MRDSSSPSLNPKWLRSRADQGGFPSTQATRDSSLSVLNPKEFLSPVAAELVNVSRSRQRWKHIARLKLGRGFDNYHKMMANEGNGEGGDESANAVLRNFSVGRLPLLTDPSTENGIMFGDLISPRSEEAQVVINFKAGTNNSGHSYGSLLNFEQGENSMLHNYGPNARHSAMDHSYQWNQLSPKRHNDSGSSDDRNCLETTSSSNNLRDNQLEDEEAMGWLYSDGGAIEGLEESTGSERNSHKRPHMGTDMECRKKQHVTGGSRNPKQQKMIASKDPQSIAAKTRRERISERLKSLQELVPNGSKVDLVTMLGKAISYVKFLQLQIKVLATDEFWPPQGGNAPDVSRVKDVIDAILSTHKDRTASSN